MKRMGSIVWGSLRGPGRMRGLGNGMPPGVKPALVAPTGFTTSPFPFVDNNWQEAAFTTAPYTVNFHPVLGPQVVPLNGGRVTQGAMSGLRGLGRVYRPPRRRMRGLGDDVSDFSNFLNMANAPVDPNAAFATPAGMPIQPVMQVPVAAPSPATGAVVYTSPGLQINLPSPPMAPPPQSWWSSPIMPGSNFTNGMVVAASAGAIVLITILDHKDRKRSR